MNKKSIQKDRKARWFFKTCSLLFSIVLLSACQPPATTQPSMEDVISLEEGETSEKLGEGTMGSMHGEENETSSWLEGTNQELWKKFPQENRVRVSYEKATEIITLTMDFPAEATDLGESLHCEWVVHPEKGITSASYQNDKGEEIREKVFSEDDVVFVAKKWLSYFRQQ